MKKIISVLIIILMAVNSAELHVDAKSVFDNYDTSSYAMTIIGSSSVFMEGTDAFYTSGVKKTYTSENISPYVENGVFMVPVSLFQCINKTVNVSGSSISANGAVCEVGKASCKLQNGTDFVLEACPEMKNGSVYVPFADFCKKIFCLNLYADNRGMYIVSESQIDFSNSSIALDDMEKSDIVYRYMQFERPSGERVIEDLKASGKSHPYLWATSERIDRIKENIRTDDKSMSLYRGAVSNADVVVGKTSTVEYKFEDSIRIFSACNEVRDRIEKCAVAYLLTGEEKYAEKIWAEMQNALNWPDWNTSKHFLDSGRLAPGIAIGYDVLHNYLSDSEKQWARSKIKSKYLDICLGFYENPSSYKGAEFRYSCGNWGAVCAGGILSVCLAIADDVDGTFKSEVQRLIEYSMHTLEFQAVHLSPDGGYFESFTYWSYLCDYITTYCIGALINSCGNDYGFLSCSGVSDTPFYEFYLKSSSGKIFSFAENQTEANPSLSQGFQMALLKNDDELMRNYTLLKKIYGRSDYKQILWSNPVDLSGDNEITLPRDKYFESANVGSMRENWYEDASYVGFVSGKNKTLESQFEKGSFVFDALGESWVEDLGADDKNISGYYSLETRKKLYRIRAEGNNCLVVNPTRSDPGQNLDKQAYFEKMESGGNSAYSVLNLTEIYNGVNSYKRGYMLGDGRQTLTVRDELSFKEQSAFYWFAHTKADINILKDGKSAVLSKNGKSVLVKFASNVLNFTLTAADAEPLDSNNHVSGETDRGEYKKLSLSGTASGNVYITAKFFPVKENSQYEEVSSLPISDWTADDISGHGARFTSSRSVGENVKVDISIDKGYSEAGLYIGGSKIADITKEDGAYTQKISYLIAQSKFNNDNKLTLIASYGSEIVSDTININRVYCENDDVFTADFSKLTDSDTASGISDCGISAYLKTHLSAEKTTLDKTVGLKLTTLDARTSDYGYMEKLLQKPVKGFSEINVEVTPLTASGGFTFELYDSDGKYKVIPAFYPYGMQLPAGGIYGVNRKYNVRITADYDLKRYELIITGSNGFVESYTSGDIELSDLKNFRIIPRSVYSGGESFVFTDIKVKGYVFAKAETHFPVNADSKILNESFNAIGDEYTERTKDKSLISKFSEDFGWTLTGEDVYLQRTEGASGAEGDYAVRVIPYGNGGNANARLKLNGWTEKVTNGKIILDYDWKLSAPAQNGTNPRMYGLPVAAGGDIITENGSTIYDTGYAMADSTWTHMRYEYDVDKNTCSLWINGTQYWDKKAAEGESSYNNLSKLVFAPMFWSAASYYTKNYFAYMSLDNIELYKTDTVILNDIKYSVDGNYKHSVSDIAEDSDSVLVEFGKELSGVNADNVSYAVNGNDMQKAENVLIDNNILSFDMFSGAKSGDKINLNADNQYFITFNITDAESVLQKPVIKISDSIGSGLSTDVQTFDNVTVAFDKATADSALLQSFSENYGWTLTGEDVYLQRVRGASGKNGDYAVRIIPYGISGNTNARFKLNGWTDEITDGTINIEFDLAIAASENDGSNIRIYGLPLAAGGQMTPEIGCNVYDTAFKAKNGVWNNYKYEYNVSDNTCSLWINGVQYWDKKVCLEKDEYNNLSQFVFAPQYWSAANYFTKNYWAHITLDNFKISKTYYENLKSITYYCRTEGQKTVNEIPSNADTLQIDFINEEAEIEKGNVYCSLNSNEKTKAKIKKSSNKSVVIELPDEIKKGDILTVFIGENKTVALFVTEGGGLRLEKGEITFGNNNRFTLKLNLNNSEGEKINGKLFVACYDSDRLLSVKIFDEIISCGASEIIKALSYPDSATTIKAMIWSDADKASPIITSYQRKLNGE